MRKADGPMQTITEILAGYVTALSPASIPTEVRDQALNMIVDGTGALLAAADPRIPTGKIMTDLVRDLGGREQATVVGQSLRTDAINAALVNGTLGYACDVEPHHPEGVLHPIAVMLPTSLAASEYTGASGEELITALILGCEIEYRLSIALGPVEQYDLGFHPSAICGCFGAAAAAGFLLKLDCKQMIRAFGLAGCQASGLMAWESDPTENSRPFQMGIAARNGLTAALLAKRGFGGPTGIFDSGHTVFGAFSRKPQPQKLVEEIGVSYDGIMELAIKPYSCVSFLHPGLDVLLGIARENDLALEDVEAVSIRFPTSGVHCIDSNPLKSHCAQYVLPVALSAEGLRVIDLFMDRREADPEVARLSGRVNVIADDELNRDFPALYRTIISVQTRSGQIFEGEGSTARGYPEVPMSADEIRSKFRCLAGSIAAPERVAAIEQIIADLPNMKSVAGFASLIGAAPDRENVV